MYSLIKTTTRYAVVVLGLLLTACVTDVYEPNPDPDPTPNPTPGGNPGFDHSTIEKVTLTVNVDDQYNGEFNYQIDVYDVNPFYNKEAKPLYRGFAKANNPWVTKLDFAQALKQIYVVQIDPTKGQSLLIVPITDTNADLSCDFRPVSVPETKASFELRSSKNTRPSNAILLTEKNSEKLEANTSYYVPKGQTVDVKNIKLQENASLYIEGTLDISANISFNGGGDQIATIVVNNGGLLQGKVSQISSASGNKKLKIIVDSNGEINTPKADMANCSIENNGSIKTDKITNKPGAGYIKNNCSIETNTLDIEDIQVDLSNNTLLKCTTFDLRNCRINLGKFAILRAIDVDISANTSLLKGIGTDRAYVDFENVKVGWNGVIYQANLDVRMGKVSLLEGYSLEDGAKQVDKEGAITIPAGDCTGEGNVVDKPDPSDPDFSEIPNGYGMYTFAMEDNWPELGDYDMNDLVLGIASKLTADRNGGITAMALRIYVRAAGATKRLGAGIQFENISSGQIRRSGAAGNSVGYYFSPAGNGVEEGQKAVLPFFDDVHQILGGDVSKGRVITNTYKENAVMRVIDCDVTFTSPVSQDDLRMSNLNFFIVNGGNASQRSEVHLATYPPTNKVKGDTKNYISKEGMVWGIMIPHIFQYPKEGGRITDAYSSFTEWSTSGGKSAQDWYMNPAESSVLPVFNADHIKPL